MTPRPNAGTRERADLFAQRDAIEFDPEMLFAACLPHDLALSDRYRPATADRCELSPAARRH
jgi:hypothetical protein